MTPDIEFGIRKLLLYRAVVEAAREWRKARHTDSPQLDMVGIRIDAQRDYAATRALEKALDDLGDA